MRKTMFVAALAAMLLFAFTGAAFAGVNHSGQLELGSVGATGPADNTVSTAAVYYSWGTGLGHGTNGATAGDNSPHGNYATTTVKCVVCHAVHYAAPGGAAVGSGQDADTLLRMRADQACVFCHATAGMSVNGRPVYDGLGSMILGAGNTGGDTSTGHITGANCSMCHTNVHGAGADHSVAGLDGYLLKLQTVTNVQNSSVDTTNMLAAITVLDDNGADQGINPGAGLPHALPHTPDEYATDGSSTLREEAVGIFCAECHDGAYATGQPGAAVNISESGTAAYSGHRIAAAATTDWNVDGSKSSGLATGTIAWAAAANCKYCHDADDTWGNDAFPHSWGGSKMWLTSGADAGVALNDELHNLPMGADPNSYDTGAPQLSDGVCLKCHVASGGASGVGITF